MKPGFRAGLRLVAWGGIERFAALGSSAQSRQFVTLAGVHLCARQTGQRRLGIEPSTNLSPRLDYLRCFEIEDSSPRLKAHHSRRLRRPLTCLWLRRRSTDLEAPFDRHCWLTAKRSMQAPEMQSRQPKVPRPCASHRAIPQVEHTLTRSVVRACRRWGART